ncbi:MAG: hypothetical protein IJ210_06230 [Clostridia bacterium]|nr:hypothetical protein [Clostridia bacterium]
MKSLFEEFGDTYTLGKDGIVLSGPDNGRSHQYPVNKAAAGMIGKTIPAAISVFGFTFILN